MPKWITHIELIDEYLGYWESKPEGRDFKWSDDAIHGIAMAGERIVDLVEISTDGGATWSEAHILSRPEANVWVSWAFAWQLPTSGRYEILVRATDSAGVTQPRTDAGVDLYDGRTGWHSVPVNVATA
jgi:DMSO/TMAO reductase YedYZ molybdopterin-dependent catalytic subunit